MKSYLIFSLLFFPISAFALNSNAESSHPPSPFKEKETTASQKIVDYFLLQNKLFSETDIIDNKEHRYRISGILTTAEWDGLHLNADNVLPETSTLNDFFITTNNTFARSELVGDIKISLPSNTIGESEVTIWDAASSDEREPMSYLQQYFFTFEFSTEGKVRDWNLGIKCNITEIDSTSDNDIVCNSEESYPFAIQLLKPETILNRVFFKLKSNENRNVNTLPELISRIVDIIDGGFDSSDILGNDGVVSLLEDASGVWVQNLTVTDITDSSPNENVSSYHRYSGETRLKNIKEVGSVEPYGQIYAMPSTNVFLISDLMDALIKLGVEIPTLPEFITKSQIGFDFGYSEPIKIYDHQFRQDGKYMRSVGKNKVEYVDFWAPNYEGLTSNDLVIFSNVWEKDNGDLNMYDCYARGYALGFDSISLQDENQNLTVCNGKPRIGINIVDDYTNTNVENFPWQLESTMYFYKGDKNEPREPYGDLSVKINHLGSQLNRTVWKDSYKNSDGSDSLPNDNGIKFNKKIYFNSGDDINNYTFSFNGTVKESDSSGDDQYFVSSSVPFDITGYDIINGSYGEPGNCESGFVALPTPSHDKLRICMKLKLTRQSDNANMVLIDPIM